VSYDLDVRSDARYSRALPVAEMAAIVAALPGVTRLTATSFALDQLAAGIHVHVHLVNETGEEDSPDGEPDTVNSVALSVPYPLLGKTGPIALEMAFQIAEKCGWSVYDPQGERDVTRETVGQGLQIQQSSGAAARSALERAARDRASLADLFGQEMWHHSLVAVVAVFGGVASASIWFMVNRDWPREEFGRYLPWTVTIGGLACLWLKGLAQAYVRFRR
jgi:hypothetical protein